VNLREHTSVQAGVGPHRYGRRQPFTSHRCS
jgi:hypothetical protein